MNIDHTLEVKKNSFLLNSILSLSDEAQSTSLYIIPAFSIPEDLSEDCRKNIIDITAALFSLRYPFGQITLELSEKKSIQNKYFFWVKQPIGLSEDDFNYALNKICNFFSLNVTCLIKTDKGMADVKIYTTDLVKNINLETRQLSETLVSDFWILFKNKQQEILEIRSSDETEIANEPQTIFGKLARKLKIDQIMVELNSLSSRS
ncbi:hypothetical protein [Acinetobacter indicus]|uniref:hypothetical protein n=1 Tax=Acinetobacter indicus TaxID=756892 RepID=UPI000CEBE9A2|nr:hypothetical protein [Acinetobacter indicus]